MEGYRKDQIIRKSSISYIENNLIFLFHFLGYFYELALRQILKIQKTIQNDFVNINFKSKKFFVGKQNIPVDNKISLWIQNKNYSSFIEVLLGMVGIMNNAVPLNVFINPHYPQLGLLNINNFPSYYFLLSLLYFFTFYVWGKIEYENIIQFDIQTLSQSGQIHLFNFNMPP